MTRIVVHAGFHKTGTSSLQDYLRSHRAALRERAAIYLKEDFPEVGYATRAFGFRPSLWRRWRFRRALRAFLAGLPDEDQIFLSWEGFSGIMPGHRRPLTGLVSGYDRAAVPLAKITRDELRRRFGPQAQIVFLYTLRRRESWLRSVWGHVVRSIQIRHDMSEFLEMMKDTPSLEEEAALLARALAPTPVETAWLEDLTPLPQGPAAAALRLIGLSEAEIAALPPARRTNIGNPPALSEAFLALNREISDKAELKRRKDALLHSRTPHE